MNCHNLDSQKPKFIHRFVETSYGNSNLDTFITESRSHTANCIKLEGEISLLLYYWWLHVQFLQKKGKHFAPSYTFEPEIHLWNSNYLPRRNNPSLICCSACWAALFLANSTMPCPFVLPLSSQTTIARSTSPNCENAWCNSSFVITGPRLMTLRAAACNANRTRTVLPLRNIPSTALLAVSAFRRVSWKQKRNHIKSYKNKMQLTGNCCNWCTSEIHSLILVIVRVASIKWSIWF